MPESVLIDVRSPQEYAAGHLPGAVNVPLQQIVPGIAALAGVDRDSPLVLYCLSGARSAMACALLAQLGYTRIVDGGAMRTLALQRPGAADEQPAGFNRS